MKDSTNKIINPTLSLMFMYIQEELYSLKLFTDSFKEDKGRQKKKRHARESLNMTLFIKLVYLLNQFGHFFVEQK